MKKASVGVLVLMAILATGCANKMVYTNPARQVVVQNTGLSCSGAGTWWMPPMGCLKYSDGFWRKSDGGAVFSSALQPLSDDVRAALDGVAGGGLAFSLGAATAQAWGIGAGIYFVEKIIQAGRRKGRRGWDMPGYPNFSPCYPNFCSVQASESTAYAQAHSSVQGFAETGMRALDSPISRPPQSNGEWGIRNRSGLRVEVWFCPASSRCDFVGRLGNREYMIVEAPRNGARYQAKLLVPNTDGGLDEVSAPVIPIEPGYDGWFVVAPPVASHKKGGR